MGSMPGRIINGLKTVAVNNPVFLLDEVDKLGKSLQGDPAAALLEVSGGRGGVQSTCWMLSEERVSRAPGPAVPGGSAPTALRLPILLRATCCPDGTCLQVAFSGLCL